MISKLNSLFQRGEFSSIVKLLKNKKRNSLESVLFAVSLSSIGEVDDAEKEYAQLLIIEPNNFDAWNNIGNIYLKKQKYQEAKNSFEKAVLVGHQDQNNLARAFVNLSVVEKFLNNTVQELIALEKAVSISPKMSLALRALGVRNINDGNYEKAIVLLNKAVENDLMDVEALANLSAAYTRIKAYEKAVEAARRALAVKPDYGIAMANLGIALNHLEEYEEAKTYLINAHKTGIKYFNLYQALAQVSINLNEEFDVAEGWIKLAVNLAPGEASIYRTMGDIVARVDRQASIEWFDRALSLDPTDALTHWNSSMNLLAGGNFKRGWEEYEWGFNNEKFGRGQWFEFNCPVWKGEDLSNKSIAIWGEQGIGDIVMFSHALNEIVEKAKIICLLVPLRLVNIYKRSFPRVVVMSYEAHTRLVKDKKKFDYHSPIASTLRWTRTCRGDFNNKVPYLTPEYDSLNLLTEKYRKLALGRPIIGVTWKAGHNELAKRKKTVTLENLTPLLKNKNVFWLSLQYGDVKEELAILKKEKDIDIYYDETIDGIKDVDNWFSQICACDSITSVATAAVHFAGAAGRAAKVMVPRGGNFNWQENDITSLWYPQIEIYRQSKRFDWVDVIERLSKDVEKIALEYVSRK